MILYRVFILLLLFFAAIQSFSQDITPDLLTEIDKVVYLKTTSEAYTGNFIEYYPDSKLIGKSGNYIEGKMSGTWTWYYKDGKVKRESAYSNNNKNGLTTYWYKNGHKQSESFYKDDYIDGKAIWFHQNGIKKKEAVYSQGKFISGTEWDENGNVIKGSLYTE